MYLNGNILIVIVRPQGDGSVKVSGAAVEEGAWHAAALDAWSLLLPLLSPGHALQLLTNQAPSFARLGDLLEAVSLEVVIHYIYNWWKL